MTTAPDPPALVPSTDDVVAARLARWAEQDAALGLVREVAVMRSLKEQAELQLIQQGTEFHRSKERVVELELFATDGRIRITELEEVVTALRAEMAQREAARLEELASRPLRRCRAVVARFVRRARR